MQVVDCIFRSENTETILVSAHSHHTHLQLGPNSRPQQTSPLRLLSLDGGGVQSLLTIMILKHLMRGISQKRGRIVEPWEAFDMIGGTSTGGLIAVMLGRLKMSIRSCETAYLQLSEGIFNPKRHTWNLPSRAKDFLLADGQFDSDVLEKSDQGNTEHET